MAAKLILNPTTASRREISLSRDQILTIGRDPSNDLVLPDAMVSRRHAVIEHRGNQFFLRDCNSANGSVVNGDRVSERGLRDGDLVAIGSTRLLFREDLVEPGAKVVPHPSAAPMRCSSCGAEYRRGDLFCRECGTQVAKPTGPPRAVCSSCGTAVPLPARFCSACGGALAANGHRLEPVAAEGASAKTGREEDPSRQEMPPVSVPKEKGQPADARGRSSAVPAPALQPEPASSARTLDPSRRVPSPVRKEPLAPPSERHLPPSRRPAPSARPSSGFGSRLAAGLVDGVFVLSGQVVMLTPIAYYWWSRELPRTPGEVPFLPIVTTVALLMLALLLGALYHIYFWGVKGTSPGKELLGLRVESEDGTCPIGLGRAGVRLFGYLLSAASFGIGFLMIASSGSGLHDRIAGTRVVKGHP